MPVLECNGMKALPGPADIHTDDDGTGFASLHTGSSARQAARDRCLFSPVTHAVLVYFKCECTGCATRKDSRPL